MTRRNRALVLYVAIAYGFTWSMWLPFLHVANVGASLPNPFLHYFAALGPLVAAIVAEWYERGMAGISDLLTRLVVARNLSGPAGWRIFSKKHI